MALNRFPGYLDAPTSLLALEGNCGPISVWLVLRHLRMRTSSERIIRLCRYSRRHGTFTIALAVALREHGLKVDFHSEEDPFPMPIERQMYKIAQKSGIVLGNPLPVDELLGRIRGGEVAIVYFKTDNANGHFSPLIGIAGRRLVLPYTDMGAMDVEEFEERWTAPGFCRQCIFATR